MGVGVGTGDCPSLTKKLELKKLILDVLCIHDYTNKKLEGGRKLEGDCQWMQELHWRKEGKYSYYIFTHGLKQILWAKLVNKKNKLYGPFLWMGFNCLRLKPLRGGSLLFTIQFPQIPGTHFIDFRRMKGWVNLAATQWFWTRDSWIGNPAPSILESQLNLNLWPDLCVDLSILKLDYNLLVNLNWFAMLRKVHRFMDHILQLSLIRTNLFWLAFLAI